MSRVGLKPIPVVEKVSLSIDGQNVTVDGPKGKLAIELPEGITIKQDEKEITVERSSELRHVRALHGTFRSLINNLLIGVFQDSSKSSRFKVLVSVLLSRARILTLASVSHTPSFIPFPKVSKLRSPRIPRSRLRESTSNSSVSSLPKCVLTIHPSHIRAKVSAMLVNTSAAKPVSPLSKS
jgi:hypothetical protein